MNALRTLPILNRPSRPSSPAPTTTSLTNATALTPALLDPQRSRSLSRQVVDKVSSLQISTGSQAQSNGHITTSQPLGQKKGSSPPHSRPPTPRVVPVTPAEGGGAGVPQSGYMDVLGLRLNESVNKACLGVDAKGKKGFKQGSGWSVGESVVKELPYPPSDAYLIRAVLRTAVRSLSIYTTRLESLLLPSLTDPTFHSALNLTSQSSHPLNASQYFALSVAHAAWETCEVLEQAIESGKWPRFVQETLRPVMDKLDLVVGKVVQPLLSGLKRDLVVSLSKIEGASPTPGKSMSLPLTGPNVPVTRESSNAPLLRLAQTSQSGTSRTLAIPTCLQHFATRVDGARRVMEIVAAPCSDDGEGWMTGVIVAVIWKGMCVIAEKGEVGSWGGRPPSPGSVSKALHNLPKEKDGSITPSASLGGVASKLGTILPSRAASRPPSPPRQSLPRHDPITSSLLSFETLVKRLIGNLVTPAPTPAVIDPNDTEHIAREALHEALEALESFKAVTNVMFGTGVQKLMGSLRRVRDDVDDPVEEALDDAVEDMPAVLLLGLVTRQANVALGKLIVDHGYISEKGGVVGLRVKGPGEVWGWTHGEYESKVLGGFGTGEEWERKVAGGVKGEVERVLGGLAGVMAGGKEGGGGGGVAEAMDWVRCLGLVAEGRCGVKVAGVV